MRCTGMLLVLTLLRSASVFAQAAGPTSAAPVLAPAPPPRSAPRATPARYPFETLRRELEKDPLQTPVNPIPGDPRQAAIARATQALQGAPELAEDSIPAGAKAALEKAEAWKQESQVPAAGKDGRVLYTFGDGLPTVVCAPLRICVLELQVGEQVVGEPHIGDTVGWNISPAVSGSGAALTTVVIIRPKEPGLDTVLVIPTNRRMYYVRLLSRAHEYLPVVAFSYSDDDGARWRELQEKTRELSSSQQVTPFDSLAHLHFDYEIAGGGEFLRPVRVADDGRKTFIQMPPGTAVREAPILVVSGLDSAAEQVNYRVHGSVYIVDRLFEHGALLLGGGKKRERVDIIRGAGGGSGRVTKDGRQGDSIEDAYLRLRREGAPPKPGETPKAAAGTK